MPRNNSVSTTGGSPEVDAARPPTYYYYKMKSADGYLLNDILSEFNPLGQLEAGGRNKYRNNYINTNVSAEMKIIDGLKLKGVFGADIMNDTRFTGNHAVAYYSSEEATEPRPIKKRTTKPVTGTVTPILSILNCYWITTKHSASIRSTV